MSFPKRPFTTSSLTSTLKSTLASQPLLNNLTNIDKLSSQASSIAQKTPFFGAINSQFMHHNEPNNNNQQQQHHPPIASTQMNKPPAPGGNNANKAASNVDMSHLTEEERLMIQSVMDKAEMAEKGIPVDTSSSITNPPVMMTQQHQNQQLNPSQKAQAMQARQQQPQSQLQQQQQSQLPSFNQVLPGTQQQPIVTQSFPAQQNGQSALNQNQPQLIQSQNNPHQQQQNQQQPFQLAPQTPQISQQQQQNIHNQQISNQLSNFDNLTGTNQLQQQQTLMNQLNLQSGQNYDALENNQQSINQANLIGNQSSANNTINLQQSGNQAINMNQLQTNNMVNQQQQHNFMQNDPLMMNQQNQNPYLNQNNNNSIINQSTSTTTLQNNQDSLMMQKSLIANQLQQSGLNINQQQTFTPNNNINQMQSNTNAQQQQQEQPTINLHQQTQQQQSGITMNQPLNAGQMMNTASAPSDLIMNSNLNNNMNMNQQQQINIQQQMKLANQQHIEQQFNDTSINSINKMNNSNLMNTNNLGMQQHQQQQAMINPAAANLSNFLQQQQHQQLADQPVNAQFQQQSNYKNNNDPRLSNIDPQQNQQNQMQTNNLASVRFRLSNEANNFDGNCEMMQIDQFGRSLHDQDNQASPHPRLGFRRYETIDLNDEDGQDGHYNSRSARQLRHDSRHQFSPAQRELQAYDLATSSTARVNPDSLSNDNQNSNNNQQQLMLIKQQQQQHQNHSRQLPKMLQTNIVDQQNQLRNRKSAQHRNIEKHHHQQQHQHQRQQLVSMDSLTLNDACSLESDNMDEFEEALMSDNVGPNGKGSAKNLQRVASGCGSAHNDQSANNKLHTGTELMTTKTNDSKPEVANEALKLLKDLKLTEQANQVMEQQQQLIKQSQELIRLQLEQQALSQELKKNTHQKPSDNSTTMTNSTVGETAENLQKSDQNNSSSNTKESLDDNLKTSKRNFEIDENSRNLDREIEQVSKHTERDNSQQLNQPTATTTTKVSTETQTSSTRRDELDLDSDSCGLDLDDGLRRSNKRFNKATLRLDEDFDPNNDFSRVPQILNSGVLTRYDNYERDFTLAQNNNNNNNNGRLSNRHTQACQTPSARYNRDSTFRKQAVESPLNDTTDSELEPISQAMSVGGTRNRKYQRHYQMNQPINHQQQQQHQSNTNNKFVGRNGKRVVTPGMCLRRREPTGLSPSPLPVTAAIQLHQMQQQHFAQVGPSQQQQQQQPRNARNLALLRSRSVTSSPTHHQINYYNTTENGNIRLRAFSPDVLSEFGGAANSTTSSRRKKLPEPPSNAVPVTPSMVRHIVQSQGMQLGRNQPTSVNAKSTMIANNHLSRRLAFEMPSGSSTNNHNADQRSAPSATATSLDKQLNSFMATQLNNSQSNSICNARSSSLTGRPQLTFSSKPSHTVAANLQRQSPTRQQQQIAPNQRTPLGANRQYSNISASQAKNNGDLNSFITSILKSSTPEVPISLTNNNTHDTHELDRIISNSDDFYGIDSTTRLNTLQNRRFNPSTTLSMSNNNNNNYLLETHNLNNTNNGSNFGRDNSRFSSRLATSQGYASANRPSMLTRCNSEGESRFSSRYNLTNRYNSKNNNLGDGRDNFRATTTPYLDSVTQSRSILANSSNNNDNSISSSSLSLIDRPYLSRPAAYLHQVATNNNYTPGYRSPILSQAASQANKSGDMFSNCPSSYREQLSNPLHYSTSNLNSENCPSSIMQQQHQFINSNSPRNWPYLDQIYPSSRLNVGSNLISGSYLSALDRSHLFNNDRPSFGLSSNRQRSLDHDSYLSPIDRNYRTNIGQQQKNSSSSSMLYRDRHDTFM